MYYCNCLESWEDNGKTGFAKSERESGVYMYQAVPTKGGMCTHCGYAAFFSKTPIAIVEQAKGDGKRKRQSLGQGKKTGPKGPIKFKPNLEPEDTHQAHGFDVSFDISSIAEVG